MTVEAIELRGVSFGSLFQKLAQDGKIIPSATALKFTADITIDEWAQLGSELGHVNRATRWYIGDWVLYGEGTFGEKCYQVADATGVQPNTVRNWASIAKRVTPSRRKEGLGISIHEEVAPLPPRDQRRLLARAEREDMTVASMRKTVTEEFPDLQRGRQAVMPKQDEDDLPETLPRSYVVDGPTCRRLVSEAVRDTNGYVKVPGYLVEKIASIIDDG